MSSESDAGGGAFRVCQWLSATRFHARALPQVHKVKTIGDAYIVCCGACGEATTATQAAQRVAAMALSMLSEVLVRSRRSAECLQ